MKERRKKIERKIIVRRKKNHWKKKKKNHWKKEEKILIERKIIGRKKKKKHFHIFLHKAKNLLQNQILKKGNNLMGATIFFLIFWTIEIVNFFSLVL